MSSHLVDTSDDENCIVAVTRFLSDLLDEGQVTLPANKFLTMHAEKDRYQESIVQATLSDA
jgi:hypothetical protein